MEVRQSDFPSSPQKRAHPKCAYATSRESQRLRMSVPAQTWNRHLEPFNFRPPSSKAKRKNFAMRMNAQSPSIDRSLIDPDRLQTLAFQGQSTSDRFLKSPPQYRSMPKSRLSPQPRPRRFAIPYVSAHRRKYLKPPTLPTTPAKPGGEKTHSVYKKTHCLLTA